MANYQVPHPDQFSFDPRDWKAWVARFERFRVASQLKLDTRNEPDDTEIINLFVYSMGPKAEDIMQSFKLTDKQAKDFNHVKKCYDEHFLPKRNIIFERTQFNKRVQLKDESSDSFITDLHKLVDTCEYGPMRDELLRDRIVAGMCDLVLSEKLQIEDPKTLTLEKVIQRVRTSEQVRKQCQEMRNKGENTSVNAVHNKHSYRNNDRNKPKSWQQKSQHQSQRPSNPKSSHNSRPSNYRGTTASSRARCGRCGRDAHSRTECPAINSTCRKCKRKGHWDIVCRSVAETAEEDPLYDPQYDQPYEYGYEDYDGFMGSITEVDAVHQNDPWTVQVRLNDSQPIRFKLDTGADVTVLPVEMYDPAMGTLQRPDKVLRSANSKMQVVGKLTTAMTINNKTEHDNIYVVRDLKLPLLGRPSLSKFDLVRRINAIDDYPELFQGLGELQEKYHITLQADAKPFAIHTPRKIPVCYEKQTKRQLDGMVQQGVISKIEEPTEWCAGMVIVPKSSLENDLTGIPQSRDGNDSLRICVDLTQLNKCVMRNRHILPDVNSTLAQLKNSCIFSKLDANSGFWQIRLDESSRKLTTFITPWGRYCFNRLPYGISSAPEYFTLKMQNILEGIPNVLVLMDDILVHGDTQASHDAALEEVLKRLSKANVTLNRKKCQFSVRSVKYLGHLVSGSGIQPDPDKVAAIRNFKTPSNVTDVQRFLGMVNQLAKFVPHIATVTKPIRELLVKSNEWVWDKPQENAFNEIKQIITSDTVLKSYNPMAETVVASDASTVGIGALLKQRQKDGSMAPIMFASRALTPTEQRYATVEKEALAVTYAAEKFSQYLLGKLFHFEVDHKPLIPLLGEKSLDQLPVRIQRMRMRLLRFQYTISHVPGKDLVVPDALSRAPPASHNDVDLQRALEEDINIYVNAVINSIPASSEKLKQISEAQDLDPTISKVKTYITTRWPDNLKEDDPAQRYRTYGGSLSVANGLLLFGSAVVIPFSMRSEMLCKIHTGHLGITKCQARAKDALWWPSITKDIEKTVKDCTVCARYRNDQAEPLQPSEIPKGPWQIVGTDLCQSENGDKYLIVTDYFSRYFEVQRLVSTTSRSVINSLKSIFARHGIPQCVRSDNGPQYASMEFRQFAVSYGFRHITSSPEYAQSNGAAERAVQTFKNILKKNKDDLPLGLLVYRNSPLLNGYSPAQLLMGRRLRDNIQVLPSLLTPKTPDQQRVRAKERSHKQAQSVQYNKRHRARQLPEIPPGTQVWVRGKEQPAQVVSFYNKSYTMNTYPSGAKFVRNRRFLTVPAPIHPPPTSDPPVPSASPNSCGDSPIPRGDPPTPTVQTHRSTPNHNRSPAQRPKRSINRPAWHRNYVWGK